MTDGNLTIHRSVNGIEIPIDVAYEFWPADGLRPAGARVRWATLPDGRRIQLTRTEEGEAEWKATERHTGHRHAEPEWEHDDLTDLRRGDR